MPASGEQMYMLGDEHVILLARDGCNWWGNNAESQAIIVNVSTCFMHCGKALRRSDMWNTSSWPSVDERPSGAELLAAHIDEAEHVDAIATSLEEGYQATLWQPGGSS